MKLITYLGLSAFLASASLWAEDNQNEIKYSWAAVPLLESISDAEAQVKALEKDSQAFSEDFIAWEQHITRLKTQKKVVETIAAEEKAAQEIDYELITESIAKFILSSAAEAKESSAEELELSAQSIEFWKNQLVLWQDQWAESFPEEMEYSLADGSRLALLQEEALDVGIVADSKEYQSTRSNREIAYGGNFRSGDHLRFGGDVLTLP